jgi:hypothetical protein
MNAIDGPLAVLCKVVNDFVEITECRCGVWPFDYFTKLIKGRVPLVCILVEEGDSALTLKGRYDDCLSVDSLLFWRSQGQDCCLR